MKGEQRVALPETSDVAIPSNGRSTLNISLVQITEPVDQQLYFPYSIAVLQTFAEAHAANPTRYRFAPPVFLREPIAQVLPKLNGADVLGCSIHIWNYQYSLALAKAAKAANPELFVVFGGPQVPDQASRAEAFLREHHFIDACVHGEGEEVFVKLIERLPQPRASRDLSGIPGISWLDSQGQFQTQGKAPRVTSLDEIPSPYLTGYFDKLMETYPASMWVGIWESNRGCPFSCTFCDWGTIQSKVLRFDEARVQAEVEWFGSRGISLIYCTDANFGILPRDLELARLLVRTKVRYGFPNTVLVQMTKNTADRAFEAFRELTDAGMLPTIPLSLQSVTPHVLKSIKRDNISLDVYHDLLKRFVNAGISTYTDHLIGLPGESFESFVASIDAIISHGQHEELRFWNTYILPNAELADTAYRATHGIESVSIPYVLPFVRAWEPVDGIRENMEMIVATSSMPKSDWVRMRSLAWMTQIFYYGRFMQLPLLLAQALARSDSQPDAPALSHSDLLLAFFEDPLPPNTPVMAYLRNLLRQKSLDMLAGQSEFVRSQDPTTGAPLWLTAPIFVLTELLTGQWQQQAYGECLLVIDQAIRRRGLSLPPRLLPEALRLALSLFQSSYPTHRFELELSHNLYSFYRGIVAGKPVPLTPGRWRVSREPDDFGRLQFTETRLDAHVPV